MVTQKTINELLKERVEKMSWNMKQKIKSPLGRKTGKYTKVAVSFDNDLFRKLCSRCEETDKKFSFVVNDLVRCGLLCVEESENDEPLPNAMTADVH